MGTSLIYLLGAGRSGTTLMATILGNQPQIQTVGEMHQFLDHLKKHKECSCGQPLEDCVFWNIVLADLDFSTDDIDKLSLIAAHKERHINIPKLLFSRKPDINYLETQNRIFETIQRNSSKQWLLDSSKYIARYLLLLKSNQLNVKGIYVVRDVRGVVNSFGKQVQSPRNPLSAILYYMMVNIFGQIVCWLDKKVIKITYEDFIYDTENTLKKIYTHLWGTGIQLVTPSISEKYEMPHIVGGNRIKVQKTIRIHPDEKWKEKMPRSKQRLYYFLAFPIMIINKYNI